MTIAFEHEINLGQRFVVMDLGLPQCHEMNSHGVIRRGERAAVHPQGQRAGHGVELGNFVCFMGNSG